MSYEFSKWRPPRKRNLTFDFGFVNVSRSRRSNLLFADQISITYLNQRLRYYYFRFRKRNGSHIGILSLVSILTSLWSASYDFASAYQISSKFERPQRSVDVISIFQYGGHGAAILLPASGLMTSLIKKGGDLSQTKLRRDTSVHGWDVTTSGFYWRYIRTWPRYSGDVPAYHKKWSF